MQCSLDSSTKHITASLCAEHRLLRGNTYTDTYCGYHMADAPWSRHLPSRVAELQPIGPLDIDSVQKKTVQFDLKGDRFKMSHCCRALHCVYMGVSTSTVHLVGKTSQFLRSSQNVPASRMRS